MLQACVRSILMPPTSHIAILNCHTPKFSGVGLKLTWCQPFGVQGLPKLGNPDSCPPKRPRVGRVTFFYQSVGFFKVFQGSFMFCGWSPWFGCVWGSCLACEAIGQLKKIIFLLWWSLSFHLLTISRKVVFKSRLRSHCSSCLISDISSTNSPVMFFSCPHFSVKELPGLSSTSFLFLACSCVSQPLWKEKLFKMCKNNFTKILFFQHTKSTCSRDDRWESVSSLGTLWPH